MLSFGQGSLRRAVLRRPGQQLLPDGSPPRRPLPAASSRWLSATSLPVCTGVPAGQLLRYGAPASNKPHPAAKSTPVWLAIWRTWAGFANSQLLPDAAPLSSMQGLPRSGNSSAQTSASLHPPAALRLRCLPFTGHGRPRSVRKSSRLRWKCLFMDCICSDIANLSTHLYRLPTPPPYLRRMRLLPGRGAGIRWVIKLLLGRASGVGCWIFLALSRSGGIGWQMI